MNARKLLSLLLALLLALGTTACAEDPGPQDVSPQTRETTPVQDTLPTEEPVQEETVSNPEEAILGSWVVYIYITEENTGLEGFETEAGLPALVTFDETGVVTMTPYEAELDAAYEALKQDLCDYIIQPMYERMEAMGLTREEVDERFQRYNGTTLLEYAQETVEELELHESFLKLKLESPYTIEGQVLILNEKHELTFELRSSTLTILDSTKPGYWEAQGMEFPVVLERVELEPEAETEEEE